MTANTPGSIGNNWPSETNKRQFVLALTWSGVIPFAVLVLFLEEPVAALLFKGYSLAIFAFLCGSWWSTALIVPSITSFERVAVILSSNLLVIVAVCLLLLPISWSLLPLSVMFLLLVIAEHRLRVFNGQPVYYKSLRLRVSLVVAGLHVLGWTLL